MFRFLIALLLALGASVICQACECTGAERPCEYLRADSVFVGQLIETIAAKHAFENDSWTPGYSMRFSVEESLVGEQGRLVTIETGSGGGDCGTPLSPGSRFLIFAHREKDGKLWTGMCSGNLLLRNDASGDNVIAQYRSLARQGSGTIFGRVMHAKPIWHQGRVDDESRLKPLKDITVSAHSEKFTDTTKTGPDGSYEFPQLPVGKYKVTPGAGNSLDFDRQEEGRYEAVLRSGQCVNIAFTLEPRTRIKGRVIFPTGMNLPTIEVVAVPTDLKKLDQFSGTYDFTDEQGRFDIWPLPPGDYYVGININGSPKSDAPFPPTYYPGVIDRKRASIVHVEENDVKEADMALPIVAAPRAVHIVAVGLDGRPMRAVHIELEDLRHPGDAFTNVNVDLDENGSGMLSVFAGYSYRIHGSLFIGRGTYWCSKPAAIPAGIEHAEVRLVMDRRGDSCPIAKIGGLKK